MRFVGNPRQDMPKGIAYSLIDYCELVDATGRCIRADKAGYIDDHHSPILKRLGINSDQWLNTNHRKLLPSQRSSKPLNQGA